MHNESPPSAPLPELVVVLEAEPGRNLRGEFRAVGVAITAWSCSLTGYHTVTLQGSKAALEQARQMPIVKRELAPGEPIKHPVAPEWVGRIDAPGLCDSVYEGPAQVSFFMKVSGPLTPEKRAALEALGMKSPFRSLTIRRTRL